jgi:adenine/guanine phosphoribosyltransferase-like PRPP-binding protein
LPILKGHDRFWGGKVAVYGDYRPWGVHKENGGTREDYPEHSKRILDLKDGKDAAVTHFKGMIEPELGDGVVVVTVPSHDPAKTGGGMKKLAAALAESGNRVDGSGCLARTKKIKKLAHGGDRGKEIHLESVTVAEPELINGKQVLLLDDVTKTGNSLEACAELLIKAGAKAVQRATIGKT